MHAKELKPSGPYRNPCMRQLLIGLIGLLFYAIPFGYANENVLQIFEKDFQKIVADACPAVVKVVATQVNSVSLQPNPKVLALTRQDIGSGILIDTTGHVVTTAFEMESPGKIEIIFNDGDVSVAKLLGRDTLTDIAVLRVTDTPQTPASKGMETESIKWGESSKISTGSWTVTIGRSYGHSPIVSFGIVGGWDTLPDQLCGELIKINAAVTPGNGGGAVVNTSGEIVGMILAVLTEPMNPNSLADLFEQQDNPGIPPFFVQPSPLGARRQEITFAMPIETVRAVAEEIIEHGKVSRGWLGVEVDIGEAGLYVTHVIEGSPAHKSGLLPEDVILEFDETAVRSYSELLRCVITKQPKTKVQLKIDRNGTEQQYTIILGEKH